LVDVVKAYKSLLKEKEALETSLRALSVSSSRTHATKSDASEEECEVERSDEGESLFDAEVGSTDAVATLTAALATVTEEKNKMEASFQADKKKLMVRVVSNTL
jgi:hypothetical protein